jgi:hypothetical protein
MTKDKPCSSNRKNGGNEWEVEAADLLGLRGDLAAKKGNDFWGVPPASKLFHLDFSNKKKNIDKDIHRIDGPEEPVFSICVWNVRMSPKKLQ